MSLGKIKDGITRIRKLKVEKEILDSKIMKGEETDRRLMEECQVLSQAAHEKRNLISELAQESENLKQTAATEKNGTLFFLCLLLT